MNILVTGASGQLGRRLISSLQLEGFRVYTLGRAKVMDEVTNFPWSLGLSPNPSAFEQIDCILHLAWSSFDRGPVDFHLNVGGTSKVIEIADILGIKIINISSLAATNPLSNYGLAKKQIEDLNKNGINLRVAKLEYQYAKSNYSLCSRFWRSLILIPAPNNLSVHVTEYNFAIAEIINLILQDVAPGNITIPFKSYSPDLYFRKYHGMRSFNLNIKFFDFLFKLIRISRTRYGYVLFDRWLSLKSTTKGNW